MINTILYTNIIYISRVFVKHLDITSKDIATQTRLNIGHHNLEACLCAT